MATIVQFVNYGAPYLGNFLRSMILLEDELEKQGDEVIYIFITPNSNQKWINEFLVSGRKAYFLSGKILKDIFSLKKILTDFKVDIIHVHFSTKALFLVNFALRLTRQKIFVIRHLHNMYIRKSNLTEALRRTLAPCDVTLGCGRYVVEEYAKEKRGKSEEVDYLTNGIDFSRFKGEERELKNKDTSKKFLTFGYDIHGKGIDLLIAAFNRVRQDGYDFKLTISAAVDRTKVEEFVINELGVIPDWLYIIDGVDDIEPYYQDADFFITASRSEGLCYSLVEAVYCGAQIIASDLGGHLEWEIPNSMIFKSEDGEDLLLKLDEAFRLSREELWRTNQLQRKFVITRYSATVWAEKMAELYVKYLNS